MFTLLLGTWTAGICWPCQGADSVRPTHVDSVGVAGDHERSAWLKVS